MSERVDEIEELKTILSYAHDYWNHYEDHFFIRQNSVIKTYLWLAVTLMGVQGYVFNSVIFPLSGWTFGYFPFLSWLPYIISMFSALIALVFGVSCLSSLFFGKTKNVQAYSASIEQMNHLYSTECDREDRILRLRGLCADHDRAIEYQWLLITKKSHRMRVQGICILLSIVMLIIFFLTLFIGDIT